MATASTIAPERQHPRLVYSEILNFAYETFCSNKVRFALTALGMVIGTASLIVVVTIGLTGKQYVMNQIQGIGANLIYAYYEGGSNASVSTSARDDLTVEDVRAVQQQVPGIQAASPMTEIHDRISVGGGKERDILVLGVSPQYSTVRTEEPGPLGPSKPSSRTRFLRTSRRLPCLPTCVKRRAPSCRGAPQPWAALSQPVPTAMAVASGLTPVAIARAHKGLSSTSSAGWRPTGSCPAAAPASSPRWRRCRRCAHAPRELL